MDILFQALFEHGKLPSASCSEAEDEEDGSSPPDEEQELVPEVTQRSRAAKRKGSVDQVEDPVAPATTKRPKKTRKPKPEEDKAAYISNKPPDFVLKLYAMFKETPELIKWDRGRIVIPQPSSKLQAVLPNYFRHGKFTSFQRQLNNFGFHKRISESTSKSRIYARDDMVGYPAEALLDLRRKPGSVFATWEPTEETRAAYAISNPAAAVSDALHHNHHHMNTGPPPVVSLGPLIAMHQQQQHQHQHHLPQQHHHHPQSHQPLPPPQIPPRNHHHHHHHQEQPVAASVAAHASFSVMSSSSCNISINNNSDEQGAFNNNSNNQNNNNQNSNQNNNQNSNNNQNNNSNNNQNTNNNNAAAVAPADYCSALVASSAKRNTDIAHQQQLEQYHLQYRQFQQHQLYQHQEQQRQQQQQQQQLQQHQQAQQLFQNMERSSQSAAAVPKEECSIRRDNPPAQQQQQQPSPVQQQQQQPCVFPLGISLPPPTVTALHSSSTKNEEEIPAPQYSMQHAPTSMSTMGGPASTTTTAY